MQRRPFAHARDKRFGKRVATELKIGIQAGAVQILLLAGQPPGAQQDIRVVPAAVAVAPTEVALRVAAPAVSLGIDPLR